MRASVAKDSGDDAAVGVEGDGVVIVRAFTNIAIGSLGLIAALGD